MQGLHVRFVEESNDFRLAFVEYRVPRVIDDEEQDAGDRPWCPQSHGPEERDACEVSQEERGVADRQQCSADIAHQEDEHDDGMHFVRAFPIRVEQRPDQEHAGPGRADEARDGGSRGQPTCVDQWVRPDVAADMNTTADDVEAEEQDDERHVFLQHGVVEGQPNCLPAFHNPKIDQRAESAEYGDEKPAQVAVPPSGSLGNKRQKGDRPEDHDEGDCSDEPGSGRVRWFRVGVMVRTEDPPEQSEGHEQRSADADRNRPSAWSSGAVQFIIGEICRHGLREDTGGRLWPVKFAASRRCGREAMLRSRALAHRVGLTMCCPPL